MSGSALRTLDSGSEHWFRERRIGSRARRDGWSEHHARADDLSRKHESSLGHRSADTQNCQSQPWNRSQHQRLYTGTAERHAGARHNLTGVGNSWGYHPATRATGAQQPVTQQSVTQQSVTKPWHEWEPVRATFEVVESRARSSVEGVPLFCPNNFGTPAQTQHDSNNLFDLRCRARILILRWYLYLNDVVLHCVNNQISDRMETKFPHDVAAMRLGSFCAQIEHASYFLRTFPLGEKLNDFALPRRQFRQPRRFAV
jgi:hypothetical protein